MEEKKILVVIPELTYSGSTFSSLRICRVLLEEGMAVNVMSCASGPFCVEYEKLGITPEIIDKNHIYDNEELISEIAEYDLMIANTVIVYAIADMAKNIIPTIWYIREAHNLSWQFCKYDYRRYYALKRAENIYAVSEYAAEYIRNNYNPNVRVVHNCVEDVGNRYAKGSEYEDDIVRFISLGSLEPRKAFDILAMAYISLPEDMRKRSEIHIAGRITDYAKDYAENLLDLISEEQGIIYHGEITDRDALLQLMKNCDVAVVPSKDESCSLVAIEAAMLSLPLILSENIGAAYLAEEGKSGWLFETDNAEALSAALIKAIENNDLAGMGHEARIKYEATSTYAEYRKSIVKMCKDNFVEDKDIYREQHFARAQEEKRQRADEKKALKPLYQFETVLVPGNGFYVYGAGEVGRAFADLCLERGMIPLGIIDRNEALQGSFYNGIKIVCVDSILSRAKDRVIYVCLYKEEPALSVMDDLEQRGIKRSCMEWVGPVLIRK